MVEAARERAAARDSTLDAFNRTTRALIDRLERRDYDGIVINPGALTHYSYALHDALVAAETPAIEVHISDIHAREPWRRVSVTRPAVTDTIIGQGWQGYLLAVDRLIDIVEGTST
ncbi:MAG: type II 3-dehydroquinate dehydratase [Chloroflexota bacterium]